MISIQISGHGIEVTPTLHEFIHKKFTKIQKHSEQITNCHVFLKVDHLEQSAEVRVHIPGHEMSAHATSKDMYQTIDLLIDKLLRQLDKHKEKANKKHQ